MCCIVKCCNCHFISAGDMAAWCGMPGIGVCVCVCMCVCVCAFGKMAKDIGMTICKSIVVSFLPCSVAFFGIPSLYVLSFFKMFFCYLFLLLFWGGRKP